MEWRPSFEEIEFEFLEVSLVGSHWMVFSARFYINPILHFHPSVRIPLGTCFLRGSWLNSLNRHKEFDIVTISQFHDKDSGQGGL